MNQRNTLTAALMSIAALALSAAVIAGSTPVGTAVTYQGLLTNGGAPANGSHHLRFQLWDSLSGGSTVGPELNAPAVGVTEGRFTVPLDFGAAAFDGSARWLGVQVITNDGATITTLTPRQPITPTPYALKTRGIFVDDAGKVGIGTETPASALSVVGDAEVTGGVRIGNVAAPCSLATAGTVRWNATAVALEYCDGTAWRPVVGPRRIYFTSGVVEDGTDNGPLASRVVSVTKASAASTLRVTYSDNLRVIGPNLASSWEARFNGLSAPSGPIRTSLYEAGNSSALTHRQSTLVGYATGLAAGTYTVQVYVGPAPGYPVNDAYTGWLSRFLLEVEEIP